MSYIYTIKMHEEYLKVVVKGHRKKGHEARHSGEYLQELADLSKNNNINKILIVSLVTGHLPATAAYNIVHHPSEYGFNRKMKFAVVNGAEETRLDLLFAEEVITNRGYRMKIFEFESDAIEWLLQA